MYVRKRPGFSLIGKCPSSFMIVDPGARDPGRGLARVVGRTGEVVLARQEIQRAPGRVDAADAVAEIALGPVEVKVPAKTPGPPCAYIHRVSQRASAGAWER